MAALPQGFPEQPLKLCELEEKANAAMDRSISEAEPALGDAGLLRAETTEAARRSLVDEDKKDNEQVSEAPPSSDRDRDTPNRKTLFNNDCGLLKLLPSKRKFVWEDMDDHEPVSCQKQEQRRRCFVRLGDESNIKVRRRSRLEQQINPNGKAANVGSFMKWMIDVGKGLAKKKRCFPTSLAANPSFLHSPFSNPAEVQNQGSEHGVQVQASYNEVISLDTAAANETGSYECHEGEGTKAVGDCSVGQTLLDVEQKTTTATTRTGGKDEAENETTERLVVEAFKQVLEDEDCAVKEISLGIRHDSSPELVATMATVKSWVYNSFKCRSEKRKLRSVSGLNCRYCGLQGHNVSECSETLELEVKELEKREALLEEMNSEAQEFPCLRCLSMGHLGAQCRFSVTEAASKARENNGLRKWEFTRKSDKAPSGSILFQRCNSLKPRDEMKTKQREAPLEKKGRKNQHKSYIRSDAPPVVPKGFFAAVESVRLSRSELWSLELSTQARGFFLRLRFGRWEKAMGGTGYRMARIRGAMRKAGDDKSLSVCVDLGDMDCTVDSQYVSNHGFTEAELAEWWKGRWRSGKRLISQDELQTKLAQRQKSLPA